MGFDSLPFNKWGLILKSHVGHRCSKQQGQKAPTCSTSTVTSVLPRCTQPVFAPQKPSKAFISALFRLVFRRTTELRRRSSLSHFLDLAFYNIFSKALLQEERNRES
ncbi:hypothetical protein AAC387_Pa04g0644 [Persea americana]